MILVDIYIYFFFALIGSDKLSLIAKTIALIKNKTIMCRVHEL